VGEKFISEHTDMSEAIKAVTMVDNPVKTNRKDIELTKTVEEDGVAYDEDVVTVDDNSLGQEIKIEKNKTKSLKHTFTMGGHDGQPLGFKIKDIMDDLEQRPGDDDKDQLLIKLLSEADKDGDGVVTLWELTEMAKKLETDEKKIKNYKLIIGVGCFGVVLLCVALMGLVAAGVELTKETRVAGNSFQVVPGNTLTPRERSDARRLNDVKLSTKERKLKLDPSVMEQSNAVKIKCNERTLLPLGCPNDAWYLDPAYYQHDPLTFTEVKGNSPDRRYNP
jgi:hypothetical protein